MSFERCVNGRFPSLQTVNAVREVVELQVDVDLELVERCSVRVELGREDVDPSNEVVEVIDGNIIDLLDLVVGDTSFKFSKSSVFRSENLFSLVVLYVVDLTFNRSSVLCFDVGLT